MVLRDVVTRETFRFRRHPGGLIETRPITNPGVMEELEPEDTIAEGVQMLQDADQIIAHNGIRFDNLAIKKLFPWFNPRGDVKDTLVLVRVIAPDVKDNDYRLAERGKLPGQLIGSHSLDAWGYRVGKHKGDYSKQMLALGRDPWAVWNRDQEDYCENDIDVTEIIWAACQKDMPPQTCVDLEHAVHDLCGVMEENGYFFDVAEAEKLSEELETESRLLSDAVKEQFGYWFRPAKKKIVKPQWDDPKGINKAKKYEEPDTEWGEDYSRAVWGRMVFPKRSMRSKKIGDRTEGAPYCPMERVEFNPASRHHIIEKFTTVYNWVPQDFTEKGFPSVSDDVLQKLALKIPEAKPLAEILFYEKLIGMVKRGKNSWILCYNPETGRIHGYINSGGTVSGRASHNNPNLGQVPAVIKKKNDVTGKKEIQYGRAGDYGWECRHLFFTPETIVQVLPDGTEVEEEWVQVGVDLKGIELRRLGEECAPFDGGKLIAICCDPEKDPHDYHMELTGLNNRDDLKRGTYGLMYGAGDWKLGHTFDPLATDEEKKRAGARFRNTLMTRVPALGKAIERIKAQAERGFLIGLDGRRLGVRAVYSSLNLRLQSDAALIAKKWLVLTEQYLLEAGLNHGWNGDFAMLTWVHDEIQIACKKRYADVVASCCVKAANDAGTFFNSRCPVDADAKIGHNWAETH
jgi:DNA polymerase I-like protein with 3'-5' exonuclease and polymerase domains